MPPAGSEEIDIKDSHKYYLGDHLYLQPLIFWFDSNHLCHVQRYLEIYRPISNLPAELKEAIGMKSLKKMILRKGDFIEDKFGQMQRILLSTLTTRNCGNSFNSVNFGSSSSKGQNKSLENAGLNPFEPQFDKDRAGTTIMVRHLNGRQRMDSERKKEVLQRIAQNKENPQTTILQQEEEYDFYGDDDSEGDGNEDREDSGGEEML
eukprot:gene21589-27627_t